MTRKNAGKKAKEPTAALTEALRRRLGVLNDDEVCALVGVKPRTTSTWRSRGEGPAFIKVGTKVLYLEDDVRSWLAQRVEQTPETKFGT